MLQVVIKGSKVTRVMTCLLGVWLLLCTQIALAAVDPTSITQVMLIQNSGWMEPFYVDPKSNFKSYVQGIADRIHGVGGEQVIASFNQSVGSNKSPVLHYKGKDAASIRGAVAAIQLAHKPGSNAYADTDFKEGIFGAIRDFSPGKPCIIWIVTNNKNSPKNSPETAEKNREFYDWLQNEKAIRRIVAYPYKMPVHGKYFNANGLMIYAIAYGEPADEVLQRMLLGKIPFEGEVARLKPLNAEAVTFIPKGVKKNENFTASLGRDGRTLLLGFDSATSVEQAELIGQFRNDFYPFDIVSADVNMNVSFMGQDKGIAASISPNTLQYIAAGAPSSDVTVSIKIPPIPSVWNPGVIFGSGYHVVGTMSFQLSNQKLNISPGFVQKMKELFPQDPLPELFVPGNAAQQSVTTRPVVIQVAYPAWPLILLVICLLLMLGVVFGLLFVLRKETQFKVSIDGVQKKVLLKPFGNSILKDGDGQRIGVISRGLGMPTIQLDKGKQNQVRIAQ